MDQNRVFLIVGTLLSIGLMLFGTFVRFRNRLAKNEAQVRKSKRLSWLLYFGGLGFMLLTVVIYSYMSNGHSIF